MLVDYLVPTGVTFLSLFATLSHFRKHTWAADDVTAVITSLCLLCIVGSLGTWVIHCLQKSFLHLCPPEALLHWVGPPGHLCLCEACWLWRCVTCRPPGSGWPTVLHPFWHESNSEWNKSAETVQKSVTVDPKNLCTTCACAQLCVGSKCSLFTVHSCNKSLSFISALPCRPISPFCSWHHSQCVHWSLPKGLWMLSFNPSKGLSNFLHEYQVLCTWAWDVYLCQTQGAMEQL